MMKFCPECGTALVPRLEGGRDRPACPNCKFIDFGRYSLGVGGVVVQDGKVLFIRRGIEPGKGRWTLPGGYVEYDEIFDEAVVREVREETGLETEVIGLVAVRQRPAQNDNSTYIAFALRPLGGTLTIDGFEVDQADFFDPAEFANLPNLAPLTRFIAEAAIRDGIIPLLKLEADAPSGPNSVVYLCDCMREPATR